MTSRSIIDVPPRGLLRAGLRLPIWLYRTGLGRLLGDRFLMLIHRGRKTGLLRRTVIEVVRHDKPANSYYVVSGWGVRSDWYQNVRQAPTVSIQVGSVMFQSTTEFITRQTAIDILEGYARLHPLALRELSWLFLGERLQPGHDAAERLASKMPMVAFHIYR